METVNLEKICELLEKGVDNPSIQNEKGKFSLEKWKKEVQPYTEPFLSIITRTLNEAVIRQRDIWKTTEFKILKKHRAKKARIDSLQGSKWKLAKPFVIEARENDLRPIEGFLTIAPSRVFAEKIYNSSICWGLGWWGTEEKARSAYEIFEKLNPSDEFIVAMLKHNYFGGTSTWLFKSIDSKNLPKLEVEAVSEIIKNDFIELSSSLYENRDLFQVHQPGEPEKRQEELPTKTDIERAIMSVCSKTGRRELGEAEVFEIVEAALKRKGIVVRSDWRTLLEGKLGDWFG